MKKKQPYPFLDCIVPFCFVYRLFSIYPSLRFSKLCPKTRITPSLKSKRFLQTKNSNHPTLRFKIKACMSRRVLTDFWIVPWLSSFSGASPSSALLQYASWCSISANGCLFQGQHQGCFFFFFFFCTNAQL